MLKITLLVFLFCFFLERVFAGWKLPKVRSWYQRVVLINLVQFGIVLLAGITWERWFGRTSLFYLSSHLSDGMAGFSAYFTATFIFYWWHRARHENDFLWRIFHQIHHSPQRLEVITSFYKHPLEMIFNSLLCSFLVYSILGLSLKAGAVYTLCTAFGEFFYHTNIRTARWVGWIFQRPEMHRIHHQHGRHKNNYGDFPIWDWIFGTLENPNTWSGHCGFDTSLELRLKEMLQFRDVHKAVSHPISNVDALLNEGDLIFIDIPSFLFRRVARSTRSWTSHVGVALKGSDGDWQVSESRIPFSRVTPLDKFINRSMDGHFEIKRLARSLRQTETEMICRTAVENHRRLYGLGFDFDSQRLFCSKHVFEAYRAAGLEVGKLQTFQQILEENPEADAIRFWKFWFFGSVPWSRRTVTPASQLNDERFISVYKSF